MFVDAPRFSEPHEELAGPTRHGRFEMEEISLSTENGELKFFNHPELGAIRLELAVEYEVEDGEEPVTKVWQWKCEANGFWEIIDCPAVELAADYLLEHDARLKAAFELHAAEKSEVKY
jgi:hypothetical protein